MTFGRAANGQPVQISSNRNAPPGVNLGDPAPPAATTSTASGWVNTVWSGAVQIVNDAADGVTAFALQSAQNIQTGVGTIQAWADETWTQAGQSIYWAIDQAHGQALYIGNQVIAATQAVADQVVKAVEQFGGSILQLIDVVNQFQNSAGAVLSALLTNPQGFVTNVLGSVGTGVTQFFSHLETNLPNQLLQWLTGPAGATIPKLPNSLNAADLGPWLLDFFQLNQQGILNILTNVVGAGNVALLADAYTTIQDAWGKAGNTSEVFDQVNALLDGVTGKLDPKQLADTAVTALVNLVVTEVASRAPAVILKKLSPAGAVLTTIYDGLMFLQDQANQFTGLVKLATSIANNILTVVNAPDPTSAAAAQQKLVNSVEGFFNSVIPIGISFAASQLNLTTLPQQVGATLTKLQNAPADTITKALKGLVGKSLANLGLTGPNAQQYQGLVGKVQTIPVGSQTHHLWVVNQNDQAVIMRASNPAPLNLAKDLPAGLSQAAIAKVTTDEQKVITLGNQVIQDGKAADAFAALAAAAKKAGQPAPPVPNPSPAAALMADTAKLNQAEQTLTSDLVADQATCFDGACFAAGTPLRTPDGSKAIEEIRVGDSVLSRSEYDPSGPVEPKVVEEVFVRIGSIWRLQVGGRSIETSGEHPFFSWEKGWVACNELKVGDLLLTESGAWSVVETVEDTGNWATLYNLRVADFHTYFVGGDGWGFAVWAHNQICGTKETPAARNASYARSFTDNPSITNPANIILKAERQARGMPRAGSPGDNATLAYVEVAGSTSPIFASNSDSYTYNFPSVGTGPGQVPVGQGVNLQARDHAEIKAMIHAAQTPGVDLRGKSITIYTDRDPCSFCDKSRGIENAARILGASSVTIWCPSGSIGPINLLA